jgi:vacuolar protein sorting-associated protein 26
LDGQESRKTAEIKTEDGKKERHYLYYDGETVSGKVHIVMDYHGLSVALVNKSDKVLT